MSVIYIAIAAFGIGLLIIVHEFGHFIIAKASGVQVEQFSIGFGPEVVGFTRGTTRYSLRWIPLGGYVKMLGDEPGSEDAESQKSFLSQTFAKKCGIIVAGSGMNVLLALVLFVATFRIGVELPAARVGQVWYGMPAYFADIRTGDWVLAINGRRDVDFQDLMTTIVLSDPGEPIRLELERDGETRTAEVYSLYLPGAGMRAIGIQSYLTLTVNGFSDVPVPEGLSGPAPESPEKAAGLAKGWTLTAFNGETLASWYDYEKKIIANGLAPYRLTAVKDSEEKTFEITPLRSPSPSLGFDPTTMEVEEVDADSLAAEMGLKPDDVITGLGDREVKNILRLEYMIAERFKDLPPLKIVRDGSPLELIWPRRPRNVADFMAGFEVKASTRISGVIPRTAAEMLGLEPGDEIIAIDGREVASFDEIKKALAESTGDTISIQWRRDGEDKEGSFGPAAITIEPRIEQVLRKLGFIASCKAGVRQAWNFATQVYIIITKALSGDAGIAKNVGGPITIVRASYRIAAERSPTQFMLFLAIISINLGIVNLLPIPILDGGHLVVFAVEKIKGSPLSLNTQAAIQYVGLAIIVALFIFVTYQDILRMIR